MNKWLSETWKSKLEPYGDKNYALKQLNELRNDLQSTITGITNSLINLENAIAHINCGLTKGHTWQLLSFDSNTYPMRKPPGVYKYECIYCGETIMLQADKKKDWEPHLRLEPDGPF